MWYFNTYMKPYLQEISQYVYGPGNANPFPNQPFVNAPFTAMPNPVQVPFTALPSAPQYQVANQQVAPENANEQLGARYLTGNTAQQQGLASKADALEANTLNGTYLNPATNPYLKATSNAATQQTLNQYDYATQPGIAGSFAAGGALGGSAFNSAQDQSRFNLANALGNINTNIYGQNYQNERQNQMNALNNVGNIQAANETPGQTLMDVGQFNQQQAQNQLNAQYQNQQNQYNAAYQNQYNNAYTAYQNQYNQNLTNYQNQYNQQQTDYQNALGLANTNYQNQYGLANTNYQNAYQQAEWPFLALQLLGSGLGLSGSMENQGISIQKGPSGDSGKGLF